MTTSIKITGGIAHGIVVLDRDHRLHGLDDLKNPRWYPIAAVGAPAGICGSSARGIAAYAANSVNYLTSIASPLARWRSLPDWPFAGKGIGGMTGDPVLGFTVFGDDGDGVQRLFQLAVCDAAPVWKEKARPPFQIRLIAGDAAGGMLAVGGDGGNWRSFTTGPDLGSEWQPGTALPFAVDLMCGDAAGGYVLYGEGQLLGIDPQGVMSKLAPPSFSIVAMTGDLASGVVAVINSEIVAYCPDLAKGMWMIGAGLPQAGPGPA